MQHTQISHIHGPPLGPVQQDKNGTAHLTGGKLQARLAHVYGWQIGKGKQLAW